MEVDVEEKPTEISDKNKETKDENEKEADKAVDDVVATTNALNINKPDEDEDEEDRKLQDIASVSVDDLDVDNTANTTQNDPVDPIQTTDKVAETKENDPIDPIQTTHKVVEIKENDVEMTDASDENTKSNEFLADNNSDSNSNSNNERSNFDNENFIDAGAADNTTMELSENDPIGNDQKVEDDAGAADNTAMELSENDPIGNDQKVEEVTKEGESILPEDQEKDEKYIITHSNCNDACACTICDKELIPKFLAQKSSEFLYICSQECLIAFKEKYSENFIERILRLRSFAIQEKQNESNAVTLIGACNQVTEDDPAAEEFEYEVDEPPTNNSSLRKCKTCGYGIDNDNYVAWEAIDFCNEGCLLEFQKSITLDCAKCKKFVPEDIMGKFCVRFGNTITQFCSTACLLSYKKSNKFCAYCQADMHGNEGEIRNFCSKRCLEICQPDRASKESQQCAVCHQNKPVEIKVTAPSKKDSLCGEPCFVAYKFVNQIELVKCESCPTYFFPEPQNPIVYSGTLPHMLCSTDCQKIFLITNRKIVICANCAVKKYDFDMIMLCERHSDTAFACSNSCLQGFLEKSYNDQVSKKADGNLKQLENIAKECDFTVDGKSLLEIIKLANRESKAPVQKIVVERPLPPKKMKNVATMCKPTVSTKTVAIKTRSHNKEMQTEKSTNSVALPIPLPIFVPLPLHMFVEPTPMLFPVPIPLPIPIFIPTGRKSANGIMKEIQKIKSRVPADPLEAELLMMAEMAAGDKKDDSSSDSDQEQRKPPPPAPPSAGNFPNEEAATQFGDDVLQMALKMASDFEAPVDLEGGLVPSTITSMSGQDNQMDVKRKYMKQMKRAMKRTDSLPTQHLNLELEKPDANLCLKYTFGVNAWKQWVTMKNMELQKTQKKPKLFKTELLQLTADDLNYSLCLFVKEVRKPNGSDYAPDTIYYLCLGIQQYLYEHGRIDNIFCDSFYEKFTDAFNEVCNKFAKLYNDSQYIVTRVEEEHLWESKQLGAHSPLVLLNTLMFFNTKHFSLTSVDEHLQLSFSHIMKHWKRNPNMPGARNVLLRFYPPQNSDTSKRKKVYEQQENDENPLRCPVKLYEFYLSKCPESVKTRNDVFYLQPERSCVPDSPVWYSTIALGKEPLERMLNRVKMVKEINIALLAS